MFKYNKMWVAGIAAPVSAILGELITVGFGIDIPGASTVIMAAVTGFLTWLVPNAPATA